MMAASRERALDALGAEVFDLLVIGGGSVGAGITLAAASQGLRVALIERGDFAGGTSSRSTKLLHGGVRYLERAFKHLDRAEYRLVTEALAERGAVMAMAPFLCRRLALVTPTRSRGQHLYYRAGLGLYDVLSGSRSLGRTRALRPSQVGALFPGMPREDLFGGVLYYDGQFDDARLNVLAVLTAVRRGAVAANHVDVRALRKERGRIVGVQAEDLLRGNAFTVRAARVINACGPFADAVRTLDDPAAEPLLRVSSGVHIVLRGGLCPPDTGILIPRTDDGRVIFILPWLGHTLVGTTDAPEAPSAHPPVRDSDVRYLLAYAGAHLGLPLGSEDVRSAWSGLRPLVGNPRAQTSAELVRDHAITESPSGLVTVVGGKWTTFRRIALDTLDHVRGGRPLPAIDWSILGTAGYSPQLAPTLVREYGLKPDIADHLAASYGARAGEVLALPGRQRLHPGHPVIEAEVRWAVRAEMARTVMDVLARRTRLAFCDREAARACAARVGAIMGAELGWTDGTLQRELAAAVDEIDGAL